MLVKLFVYAVAVCQLCHGVDDKTMRRLLYVPPSNFAPTIGFVVGPYGQMCPSSLAQQCGFYRNSTNDQLYPNEEGLLYCSTVGDCCQCEKIICGYGMDQCRHLQISGPKGAYGVKDIQMITGLPGQGRAILECTGVDSCRETVIKGNGVADILCRGANSCKDAEITITDPTLGLNIECAGTACEGAKFIINFGAPATGSCTSSAVVYDLGSIRCVGAKACTNMQFTVNNYGCSTVMIATLECDANSCDGAQWSYFGTAAVGIRACHLPFSTPRCLSYL